PLSAAGLAPLAPGAGPRRRRRPAFGRAGPPPGGVPAAARAPRPAPRDRPQLAVGGERGPAAAGQPGRPHVRDQPADPAAVRDRPVPPEARGQVVGGLTGGGGEPGASGPNGPRGQRGRPRPAPRRPAPPPPAPHRARGR